MIQTFVHLINILATVGAVAYLACMCMAAKQDFEHENPKFDGRPVFWIGIVCLVWLVLV